ncbi:MAG TPA: hypothetical protein VEZ20_03620 [Allosphingosinicella sp.]|nr:hypothetical protein [Allosphingosinicella sp.]
MLTAVLLAAIQSAPGAQPPAMLTPERPAVVQRRAVEACGEAVGSEIVVCGRREADARYRLPPEAPAPVADEPRNILGFRISENIRAQVDPVQYELPNGMIARGIVARVRIAF